MPACTSSSGPSSGARNHASDSAALPLVGEVLERIAVLGAARLLRGRTAWPETLVERRRACRRFSGRTATSRHGGQTSVAGLALMGTVAIIAQAVCRPGPSVPSTGGRCADVRWPPRVLVQLTSAQARPREPRGTTETALRRAGPVRSVRVNRSRSVSLRRGSRQCDAGEQPGRERRSRHGHKSDRRREGRHDAGVGRRQPRRARHRPARAPLPCRPGQDQRARRIRRAPGHLRSEEGLQAHQARRRAVRPPPGSTRAPASSSSASTTSAGTRSVRRSAPTSSRRASWSTSPR